MLVHKLYAARGHFDMTGDTGRRYRILRGCQLNVEELDLGVGASACCASCRKVGFPSATSCWPKRSLEFFEPEALKVAQHVPPRDGTFAADVCTGGRYRRY